MVDTVSSSVHNLPTNLEKVAGYATGTPDIKWDSSDWDRFRDAAKVPINQTNTVIPSIPVVDAEPGAMQIPTVVDSVRVRKGLGKRTTVYLPDSWLVECEKALSDAGLSDWADYGIANWNLSREEAINELGGRIVWVQYASPTSNPDTFIPGTKLTLREANADLSVTVDSWFPVPRPKSRVRRVTKRVTRRLSKGIHLHKKVATGAGTGGIATGLIALLNTQFHTHLTAEEGAAIATILGYTVSYLTKDGYL